MWLTFNGTRPARLGTGTPWIWASTETKLLASTRWGGSLLLRPSTISNALDVIVGGNFDQAGPAVSYQVARWVIGANDCTNGYPPSVTFYSPLSSRTYLPRRRHRSWG